MEMKPARDPGLVHHRAFQVDTERVLDGVIDTQCPRIEDHVRSIRRPLAKTHREFIRVHNAAVALAGRQPGKQRSRRPLGRIQIEGRATSFLTRMQFGAPFATVNAYAGSSLVSRW